MALRPDLDVTIFGLKDEFIDQDLPAWAPLKVFAFDVYGWKPFGYAPALRRTLLEYQGDILHSHGLWQYTSIAVSAWHARSRKPYLISAHGMLDAWAIRNSAWKKHLASLFYEHSHLAEASCLRALCQSEADSYRALGLKNPICIIPNGTDLIAEEKLTAKTAPFPFQPFAKGRKVLLYLGRFHQKKGLGNLLRAWKQVIASPSYALNPWVLAMAGWNQSGHEDELKQLSVELGLTDSVHFLGPQFGEGKDACYRDCDAFVLPSLSEGLPMVILEAWSFMKPVLMTAECNLPEGFVRNAALPIAPTVPGIVEGLTQLVEMSDDQRRLMGREGNTLVRERFNWPSVAAEMASVYKWILGSGSAPDCIRLFSAAR